MMNAIIHLGLGITNILTLISLWRLTKLVLSQDETIEIMSKIIFASSKYSKPLPDNVVSIAPKEK